MGTPEKQEHDVKEVGKERVGCGSPGWTGMGAMGKKLHNIPSLPSKKEKRQEPTKMGRNWD